MDHNRLQSADHAIMNPITAQRIVLVAGGTGSVPLSTYNFIDFNDSLQQFKWKILWISNEG